MIRVRYSDGEVVEYASETTAKFMISSVLFESRGVIVPVEVVEVFGVTTGGVFVERELKIRLGIVEFESVDF